MLQARSNQDYTLVRDRVRDILEEVPAQESDWVFRVQPPTKRVWLSKSKLRQWGGLWPVPTATPGGVPSPTPTPTPVPGAITEDIVSMWTASLLVHAAYHVELYDKLTDYNTCEAELQALERQRDALTRIRDGLGNQAPPVATTMIAFVQTFIVEGNCRAEPENHVVP